MKIKFAAILAETRFSHFNTRWVCASELLYLT